MFFYAFEENNDWVFRLYVYNGNYFNVTMPQGTPVYGNRVYTTYTYDANGNVLTATYDNGTSTEYAYNKANLPTSVTNKQGTATVSSYAYTYYLSGNVRTITENTGKVTTYTYDKLGRLTAEQTVDNNTTSVIQYTYDNRSNRATMTKNGYTTTYTYDLNNRLTAESKSGEVKVYSYDNNGNLTTTLVNNNFAGIYAYDLFNRQVSFSSNSIGFTYYTYRPDGLRHSAGTTKHFWSGANIVLEKTGSTITEYHRGLTLIYYKQGSTVRYYLYNGHGDVVKLTTDTGVVVKTYIYDAFGEEQDIVDSDTNHFRYCGEYYDKETKTLYLRARYYSSSTGRFTQQDDWEYIDVGNSLTSNLYTYCWNNPVNGKDPSGHWVHILVGAICGALISGVVKVVSNVASGKDWHDGLAVAALTGAASGALAASGVGLVASIAGNAAISMAGNAAQQVIDNKGFEKFDVADMLVDGAIGAVAGAVGGRGASYGNSKTANTLGKQLVKRVAKGGETKKAIAYYMKNMKVAGGESIYTNLIKSIIIPTAVSAPANVVKEKIKDELNASMNMDDEFAENNDIEETIENRIIEPNTPQADNSKLNSPPKSRARLYNEICLAY